MGRNMLRIGSLRLAVRMLVVLVAAVVICPCEPCYGGESVRVGADSVSSRLERQLWLYPQEKVHVTTDQSRYVAGDTVWLRAWVVDASTHRQVTASRYVYLELSDPFGAVVGRVKLREQDGRFPGYMALDPELAEGDYTLTAHTSFMEGPGSGYFFRKRLGVVSAYAGQVVPEVAFGLDDEGRVEMTALLRDRDGGKHWYESMSVTTKSGKVREWRKSDGERRVRLSDEDAEAGSVLLSVDNYRKYISLPSPGGGVDVTFHPEGGYLVAGEGCRVGVKAIDRSGRGVDVSGVVRDSSGVVVDSFRTVHRGMGEFSFVPSEGAVYVAEVGGVGYPLPPVVGGVSSLHVDNSRKSSVTAVAVGAVPEGSVLVVHNRGRAVYAGGAAGGVPVRIPREYLGEGVVQFLLVDGLGRALSERLAFNRAPKTAEPVVSLSDSAGGFRTVGIHFPAGMRGADVAVAVLDCGVAEPDSTVTIESQLLLQGDLRGHVEDAGWYFRHSGRDVDMVLDALMLTQGWRRYDVPSVLSGVYSEPSSAIEVGPEIIGVVKSRWRGRPMEGATVNILAPSIDYAGVAVTDSAGRFSVTDVDFPEGTKFVVQALNPKGENEHNFDVDEQEFPESASIAPESAELGAPEPDSDEGIDYGWRVSHVNGNMSVTLGEITVRRHKRKDPDDIYEILASRTFTTDDLERDHITSYEEALRKIAGLVFKDGSVIYRNFPVSFFVDGMPFLSSAENVSSGRGMSQSAGQGEIQNSTGGKYKGFGHVHVSSFAYREMDRVARTSLGMGGILSEFSSMYPIQNVKKIQFFKPNEALIFGGNSITKGGVIMVTMKDGSEWKGAPSIFIKAIAPLGYQKPAEFYTPKYELSESSDYLTRSTLHWIPVKLIDDSDMRLYIPSTINNVAVQIEGIDDNGNIISVH